MLGKTTKFVFVFDDCFDVDFVCLIDYMLACSFAHDIKEFADNGLNCLVYVHVHIYDSVRLQQDNARLYHNTLSE